MLTGLNILTSSTQAGRLPSEELQDKPLGLRQLRAEELNTIAGSFCHSPAGDPAAGPSPNEEGEGGHATGGDSCC